MHWLGPFLVVNIRDYGVIYLAQLDGIFFWLGWLNPTHINPFTPIH
jgi:hypothetical protein